MHRSFIFSIIVFVIVAGIALAEITEVGFLDTPEFALGVKISRDMAFVGDGFGGVVIVDVSDPVNPAEMATQPTEGAVYDVKALRNIIYVCEHPWGFRVIDISDPENPDEIGFCDSPGEGYEVDIANNTAYIATLSSGLRIIDISDPTEPFEIGSFEAAAGAHGIEVNNNLAFIADCEDGFSGLRIVDVTDPENPEEIGNLDTPGSAYSLAYRDDIVYVADFTEGLRIIDVSDPTQPEEIGSCITPERARAVAVRGNYAFVADDSDGLRVIDISDPTQPEEVDFYDTPGESWDVAIVSNFVYVADGSGGMRILDVSQAIGGIFPPAVVPGWNLISLPLNPDPDHNSPQDLFGDYFRGAWRICGFDMDSNYYDPAVLSTGRGYWLAASVNDTTLDLAGTANDEDFSIDLDLPWNCIGDPFDASVALDDALFVYEGDTLTRDEAVEAELIVPILYGLIPNWGYFFSQRFEPWGGYMFCVLVRGIEMIIPHPEVPGLNPVPDWNPPRRDRPSAGNWTLAIEARNSDVADRITEIGAHLDATDGFDLGFDYPEPLPGCGVSQIRAYFRHNDWRAIGGRHEYNRDIRRSDRRPSWEAEWELYVVSSVGDEVTLSWYDRDRNLPVECVSMFITDVAANQSTDIFAEQSYTYQTEAGAERLFRIGAVLSAPESEPEPSQSFELYSAYPNPFNSSVTMQYYLPVETFASLDVYDINGRVIFSLATNIQKAGLHSVVWDAGSNPAGLYLIRMEAADFYAVRKIILIR